MKRTTTKGTPCAQSWDDDWIAIVNKREAELRRPICGARTMNGTPCILESDHPSGRCKHHGGFNLTGAPQGNRNAIVHGLYAQRLTVCGTHCPMWKRCPCASDRITALPPKERPLCPYEQQLFETAYTDELGETATTVETPSPLDAHLAHVGALHTVMLWRAAAAMAQSPLIEDHPSVNNKPAPPTRLHAYTEAYSRISREHERWRRLMEHRRNARKPALRNMLIPDGQAAADHAARRENDTQHTQAELLHHEPHCPPEEEWLNRYTDIAHACLRRSDPDTVGSALSRAQIIDRAKADTIANAVIAEHELTRYQERKVRKKLGLPAPPNNRDTNQPPPIVNTTAEARTGPMRVG